MGLIKSRVLPTTQLFFSSQFVAPTPSDGKKWMTVKWEIFYLIRMIYREKQKKKKTNLPPVSWQWMLGSSPLAHILVIFSVWPLVTYSRRNDASWRVCAANAVASRPDAASCTHASCTSTVHRNNVFFVILSWSPLMWLLSSWDGERENR